MMKHWQEHHSQEQTGPKFRVRKVDSFRDSLSRQISESVRIDLRGENVLNSRTEYSRCRLPRLTLDKEVWKTARKEEEKLLESVNKEDNERDHEDCRIMEMRQKEADRMTKKRKTGNDRGKAERRTLDPLLEWGNGEGDENLEDGGIMRWLGLELQADRSDLKLFYSLLKTDPQSSQIYSHYTESVFVKHSS